MLRVLKYDALGNTYLILDPRRNRIPAAMLGRSSGEETRPSPRLVSALCDEATGLGSNGLLYGPLPSSSGTTFRLFVINSDGTTAGFSGNGTRIFAKYLIDSGDVQPGQAVAVEIPEEKAGQAEARNTARVLIPDKPEGPIEVTAPHVPKFGLAAVAADATFEPRVLAGKPAGISFTVTPLAEIGAAITGSPQAWATSVPLDIGNPHCVTFVANENQMPSLEALRAHDGALRAIAFRGQVRNPSFANGVNLQWAWPESRKRLRLMIYERGEGPTLASGSSACAAACAAFALGVTDADVDVAMPGGVLSIRVDGSPAGIKAVTLSGSATRILDREVDLDSLLS